MTLIELIESGAAKFTRAQLAFGHGTTNAFDESAWLVLWCLGMPLDTELDGPESMQNIPLAPMDIDRCAMLFEARIETRKPAAYLTHEAWLQGVSFYVDERVIIPRSLIAELLADGSIDYWLRETARSVLDLCTGNGSLAILAALSHPDMDVVGADLSLDALAVARINVDTHELQDRITLVASDGLAATELQERAPFDLILCNPPYVNAHSMAQLPPEYLAEPAMALDGNRLGGSDGMDFVRTLIQQAPQCMAPGAALVLEIGNERHHFEAAFPRLEVVWLETSAGCDQVLVVTREALIQ